MKTKKPQYFTRLILAGMLISLVPLATQVQAWSLKRQIDNKHYPASNCVRANGPDSIFYAQDGSIENRGTKSITVNCPIVRDETRRTKGGNGDFSARFYTEKDNVHWCRVRVIQPTKTGSGYKNLATENGTVKENDGVTTYRVKLRDSGYPIGAMYMGSCSLPPQSRLIAYSFNESSR